MHIDSALTDAIRSSRLLRPDQRDALLRKLPTIDDDTKTELLALLQGEPEAIIGMAPAIVAAEAARGGGETRLRELERAMTDGRRAIRIAEEDAERGDESTVLDQLSADFA